MKPSAGNDGPGGAGPDAWLGRILLSIVVHDAHFISRCPYRDLGLPRAHVEMSGEVAAYLPLVSHDRR